jgi:hypothetical protein
MRDLGEARLLLGIEIERDRRAGTITIRQCAYVEHVLATAGMADAWAVKAPLDGITIGTPGDLATATTDPSAVHEYQRGIGVVLYMSQTTRPDLAYAGSLLSRYCAAPTTGCFAALKKVWRYLRGTTAVGLQYRRNEPLVLEGYCDADWAGDEAARRSTGAYFFRMAGAPVSWRAARQPLPASSSTEAEYMAVFEGVNEVRWLRQLVAPLGIGLPDDGTPLHCDSQPAIAIAKDPKHHGRTKHIDVKYHIVRFFVANKVVRLVYVPTKDQLADIGTKALRPLVHRDLARRLGLVGL